MFFPITPFWKGYKRKFLGSRYGSEIQSDSSSHSFSVWLWKIVVKSLAFAMAEEFGLKKTHIVLHFYTHQPFIYLTHDRNHPFLLNRSLRAHTQNKPVGLGVNDLFTDVEMRQRMDRTNQGQLILEKLKHGAILQGAREELIADQRPRLNPLLLFFILKRKRKVKN